MLQFTLCGIPLPHICWKRAQIYGIYKDYLVMQIAKQQKYILILLLKD